MRYCRVMIILCLLVMCYGCTDKTVDQSDINNEYIDIASEVFSPLAGADFTDNNFNITQYNISVTEGNVLHIEMKYSLSDKLYDKLLNGNSFDMVILYPDLLHDIVGHERSETVTMPSINEYNQAYAINIQQKLPAHLDSSLLELILNHDAYTLEVFNEDGSKVYTEHNIKYSPGI